MGSRIFVVSILSIAVMLDQKALGNKLIKKGAERSTIEGKAKDLFNIGLNFPKGVVAVSGGPKEEGEKFIFFFKAFPKEVCHEERHGEKGVP